MTFIQIIAQWIMLPLIAAWIYFYWRATVNQRAIERIHVTMRRHIAERRIETERMKTINDRYTKIINDIHAHWNLDKEED